jgi:hypothetical protein
VTEPVRDWRCRIGWHSYARRRNDPAARSAAGYYLECRRCHKVRPLTEGSSKPYPIGDMDQSGGI